MPHAGGGGHSGGGHGGGSHSSSSSSSTPHYTKAYHPVRGYLIHGHYYDADVHAGWGGVIFAAIWTLASLIPLGAGILSAVKQEASYDEDTFFSYSMDRYEAAFGASSPDYEDHIVTVFALDKPKNEYHYYSIVGDNVKYNVDVLFGNNASVLGNFLTDNVPADYSTNFDQALSLTIGKMKNVILALGNDSNLKTATGAAEQNGILLNQATCFTSFDENLVNSALASFQASTGLGYTVVVEDFANVFQYDAEEAIILIGVGVLFMAIGAFALVSTIRSAKEIKEAIAGGTSSPYYYDESSTAGEETEDRFK